MNVWIINQYAIAPDSPGGTRHYDLATELAGCGFAPTIFASDVNLATRAHMRLSDGEPYRREAVGRVEFVWIGTSTYQNNDWRRTRNLLAFAINTYHVGRATPEEPPDVIIGSSPSPFAALAAFRLARRHEVRFVLELRDLWPQALVDIGGFRERHPAIIAMRVLERYLYRAADAFIVLARGSETYLERCGFGDRRIAFIPNGVHFGHFRASHPRADVRRRLSFDRLTVIYAGAHGLPNGLNTVLHAAALVSDLPIEFVLIGDGPAKPDLIALAAKLGIRNVRFLPPVPKEQIPEILAAADIGLITLRNVPVYAYGVSPNKLFDYMAAALPVICSVPGDMAAMIREAGAGISVEPDSPATIANAVRTLFSQSAEERAALGRAGYTYLAANFRREALTEKLASLLRDTVRG